MNPFYDALTAASFSQRRRVSARDKDKDEKRAKKKAAVLAGAGGGAVGGSSSRGGRKETRELADGETNKPGEGKGGGGGGGNAAVEEGDGGEKEGLSSLLGAYASDSDNDSS